MSAERTIAEEVVAYINRNFWHSCNSQNIYHKGECEPCDIIEAIRETPNRLPRKRRKRA